MKPLVFYIKLRAHMKSRKKQVILLLAVSLFLFWDPGDQNNFLWAKGPQPSSKARLLNIEEQDAPDGLKIIVTTTQPVTHRSFTLSDPSPRLVVDLTPCHLETPSSFSIKNPYLEKFKIAQFKAKTVRLVFCLPVPIKYTVTPQEGKPFHLLIDISKTKAPPSVSGIEKKGPSNLTVMTIEQFKTEKSLREQGVKNEEARSQKKRVTFDFYMTNLHNVLRLIGEIGGVNIVVGDDVKEKKITLSLREVPWDEALNSILDSNNLRKLERGEKTYLVTTSENYKKIRDEELKSKNEDLKNEFENLKNEELRQKLGKVPWITRQFQIKNIDVKFIEDKIKEVEEKEALQTGKTTAASSVGGPGVVSLEKTVRWTGVTLISVPHTNTLIVKGTDRDVEYIGELIRAIDQPIPQVMIEARIVEADTNFTRDLGIRWGGSYSFANASAPFAGTVRGGDAGTGTTPSNYAVNLPLAATSTAFGGLGIAFAGTNFNLDARLQAMEQEGRGRTISSPKILTKPDNEATIKQGSSIPVTTRDQNNSFSTNYRDAALILSVKPQIASSKKIRIHVKITKNEPDFTKVDSLGNPTINMKEAETEMIVNDGDTVVIGGIIFKTESYQINKVPGLGDIPVLGWLFKTKYKKTDDSELLIFLTPKIERASTPEIAAFDN
jgi:type IV pilus assembly protein PilQ